MSFKKQRTKTEKEPERTFTETDFHQVAAELAECRQEGLTQKEAEQNWLVKRGAVKIRDGEMVVLWNGFDEPLYRRTSDLLSSYYTWKGRKEFGEARRLEDYSKVAEQMNV